MIKAALAGLTVLVIGDSHMVQRDYLISSLHDQLLGAGAEVHSYGLCGANAGDWVYPTTVNCGRAERHNKAPAQVDNSKKAPTWTIDELIQRHHPNLIVVEIADTMAGYGQTSLPEGWIYGQIRPLTARIKAANVPCIWVGPAWGNDGYAYHKTEARVREMSEFLARTVSPCSYIDSTQFSRPGEWSTIDGQHFTASGYRAWGQDIAGAIVRMTGQISARP